MTSEPVPDPTVRIDDLMTSVWALAALAATAGTETLTEEQGALLGQAGFAERGAGGWQLLPGYRATAGRGDGAFAARTARALREAADAAEGHVKRASDDDDLLLADGASSGEDFAQILDLLASRVPGFDALLHGQLRFLDVGTGIGGITATVLARVPGARAVALDIQPRMLRLAEEYLVGHAERVELRLQDVTELPDQDAYDLAWLPVTAVTPEATAASLPRILRALRPGGWLVSAAVVYGHRPGAAETREAAAQWRVTCDHGTPWSAEELSRRLAAAGYRDVRRISPHPRTMAFVAARAPAPD